MVCVAGHLRDEKDPLRTAYAVKSLPSSSKIHVIHYGKSHNKKWEYKVRIENASNRRYYWAGEISQSLLRIKFSRANLMVLSSHMEGGANIISEAIMADIPIIASNIEGSIGLLGKNYSGYYAVGDTQQLKSILLRCERDKKFYNKLKQQCRARRNLFSPDKELCDWKRLVANLI